MKVTISDLDVIVLTPDNDSDLAWLNRWSEMRANLASSEYHTDDRSVRKIVIEFLDIELNRKSRVAKWRWSHNRVSALLRLFGIHAVCGSLAGKKVYWFYFSYL